MDNKLQPYEISIWDDVLVEEEDKSYYKEVKIATIGSEVMTAPNRAINPVFTYNVNGEITLTFSIVHRYYDDLKDDYVINPLEKFLINERKVKLFYDNQWYDFVIKSCEESSDSNVFDYTAKGLFVNELGKVGYSIVLSNDLKNNQGTIFELAEKAVEGTDWVIDKEHSDIIQQFVAEPLYIYKNTEAFSAKQLIPEKKINIAAEETLYLFYSTISNSQTKYVQFLRDVDFKESTLDDNNVAQMPNYMFYGEANYDGAPATVVIGDEASGFVTLELQTSEDNPTGINPAYQGYRLAYNQLVGYDTLTERPVSIYEAEYEDGTKKTIYQYTDYEYVTSDIVTSYVTNGSGFNIYSNNGSLEGWSNATPTETSIVQKPFSALKGGDNLNNSTLWIKEPEQLVANLKIALRELVSTNNTFSFIVKTKNKLNATHTIKFDYPKDCSTIRVFVDNVKKLDWSVPTENIPQELNVKLDEINSLGEIEDISYSPESASGSMSVAMEKHVYFKFSLDNKEVVLQPLELATYPSIGEKTLPNLASLNGIRGFLKTKFKDVSGKSTNYINSIYNSGIDEYRSTIESFSKGEQYVFRFAYGTTEDANNDEPAKPAPECNTSLKAVIAKYTLAPQKIWNEKEEKEEDVYLYTVDPKNVLFEFDGTPEKGNNVITGGEFRRDDEGNCVAYIKDGVSVTPSVDYCYQEGDGGEGVEEYIWDLSDKVYKSKEDDGKSIGFLDYYYIKGTCKKAISNTELADSADDYGLFLYTDDPELVNRYVYIKEIQLFKYKTDADDKIVLVGNVPKATSIPTDYFYLKPTEDMTDPNAIEKFMGLDAIADYLAIPVENIKPLYNENFEKISSIEASQSNCFNIVQDLCEAFECWARFNIEHEKNGAIKLNADGAPLKTITFHKYTGDDNFAGFKYGINLENIQRTIESDEFVSKLIVEQVENDTVDGGVVSIAGAPSNPSGESYILNMSYYLNHGLIENPEQYYADYNNFISQLKEKNLDYTFKKTQWQLAAIARTKANSNTNTYKELIDEAEKDLTETQIEFKNLTGLEYTDYSQLNGYTINFKADPADNKGNIPDNASLIVTLSNMAKSIVPSFFDDNGEEILFDEHTVERDGYVEVIYSKKPDDKKINDIRFVTIVNKIDGFKITNEYKSYTNYVSDPVLIESKLITDWTQYIWEVKGYNKKVSSLGKNDGLTINIVPSDDNETLITLIGKIYTDQQTIENYQPLLDTSKEEKKNLDLLIDGTKNYALTVSTFSGETEGVPVYATKEFLDDYIEGLRFTLSSDTSIWDVETSGTEKSFSQDELYTRISFTQYPPNYQLKYIINDETYVTDIPINLPLITNGTKVFTLIPIEEKEGIKDEMERILDEKSEIEKEFYKKYSRFIQEGSWTSQDYIDNELYYLDALNVSRVNGQPKVNYNLNVYEISEQEGLQNYKFNVGDKTYIEDVQFFGYKTTLHKGYETINAIDGVIILPDNVTEVEKVGRDLDHFVHFVYDFIENKIYIDDTEKIEGTEPLMVWCTYKISTPIREEVVVSEVKWQLDDPTQNEITIQNYKTQFDDLFQRMAAAVQSVEYNSASYSRAASMLDEGGFINAGLLLKSLNELSGGYSLSGDGSITAAPDGIIIKDLTDPNRQMKIAGGGLKTSLDGGYNWDTIVTAEGIKIDTIDTQNVIIKDGDNPSFRWDTYGLNAYGYGEDKTDLKTYVRFDKYGLYGIQNAEDFKAQSLDDVKNTAQFGLLWDGFFIKNSYTDGYVSISSDEDFQVVANDQERIKIGALKEKADGYEYGIRISNVNGEPVFVTDDSGDIEMTGTINATGGAFTNEVNVGSGSNTIILRGTADDALIGSSQYFSDSTKGWVINSDGDAVFNNISARGAIKTAVFEYSEIQAVGGVFLFRPSTTIKNARVDVIEEDIYVPYVPEVDLTNTYYTYNQQQDIYEQVVNPTRNDMLDYYYRYSYEEEGQEVYYYEKVVSDFDPEEEVYYTYNAGENTYVVVENPTIDDALLYYLFDSTHTTYGDDLYLKVENPLLFKVNDWCKVSNYNSEDLSVDIEKAGLTNVYRISSIVNGVITLENGAETFKKENGNIEPINSNIAITIEPQTENKFIISELDDLKESCTYTFNFIEGENDFSESESGDESEDEDEPINTLVAYGVSRKIISEEYVIKYIGNLRLWNNPVISIDGLEETTDNFLVIEICEKNNGNDLSEESESNENQTLCIYCTDDNPLHILSEETSLSVEISQQDGYDIESLVGGALLSFANYDQNQSTPELTNNYGIGINSSDDSVNLPARAISLFESKIHPDKDIKVGYNFRGILGTLPKLPAISVNTNIYNNMIGTQGIYTDNMYLGDLQQYLAFYTDKETGEKKLRISAAEISFEIPDEHGQGSGHYQNVADIEAEGVPGPPGEDAISISIDSTAGILFVNDIITSTLVCTVKKGSVDITNDPHYNIYYTWKKRLSDGSGYDPDWGRPLEHGNRIDITSQDVDNKGIFECEVIIQEV